MKNPTFQIKPTLCLLLLSLPTPSLFAQDISLPAPQKSGGMPLWRRWPNVGGVNR